MQKASPALIGQRRAALSPRRPRTVHVRSQRNLTSVQMLIALFLICMLSTNFNIMLFFQSISDQEGPTDTDPDPMRLYHEEVPPALRQNSSYASALNSSWLSESRSSSLLPELRNISSVLESQKNVSLSELKKNQTLPAMSAIQWTCYQERDHGLVSVLRASAMTFCGNGSDGDSKTKVTIFNAPGNVRATLFSSLSMDFRLAKVSRSIASLTQDGGAHDPRFELNPSLIQCSCPELGQYGSSRVRTKTDLNHPHRTIYVPDPLRLWHPALDKVPEHRDDLSTLCSSDRLHSPPIDQQTQQSVPVTPALTIVNRAILMARKDDHNPFFQVSSALNAWILMKALDWDPDTTQVVQMDDGFPSPIDSLHHQLLAPNRPMIFGKELKGNLVKFTSQVLLPPFESDGPMMQDLNGNNKCFNSSLIRQFRLASLQALNATTSMADDGSILVTVISRRPYSGRKVQRMWLNENEVLEKLREVYANKRIQFQAIDFVALDLREQMQIMLESDVVIGMHGAGLVNVLWTRPNTLVVEIFPRQKRRWGYRNICQNIGCNYHEFRGGNDIPTGRNDPNANDKVIPSQYFLAFFKPLLQTHLESQGRELLDSILVPTSK